MTHIYNDSFFNYIDHSARRSAQVLTALLFPLLRPASVVDMGCGRGIWLDAWQRAGADTILGVDGDYVDPSTLAIAPTAFVPSDLTMPLETRRRFDLAQSLEVGEHLPATAAATLVDSLTRASDRVLFSAAVVGQGGEHHINERPLSYWQALFKDRGYSAYDYLRPQLRHRRDVAPWYRYNTLLYLNDAGRAGVSADVLRRNVPPGHQVPNGGDVLWRLRCAVVSHLPRATVTRIAQIRATALATRFRDRPGPDAA
ncbi:methyltransferase domain-containing protein [Roseobacter sp.]|uniref:methyltransferase domain-containing protein n=1 Tax=Roseobacter sp. TaxID=1907202 RepID=UPI003296A515